MSRTLLSSLAAAAILASASYPPAQAKQFRPQNGYQAGQLSGNGTAAFKRANRAGARRAGRLTSGGQAPSANTAATIHMIGVYLQWRKCLDNMLPQCP